MKIAILANSQMAVPSMQMLAQNQRLAGLAIPDVQHDGTDHLRAGAAQVNIPVQTFSRDGFSVALKEWLQAIGADALWVYTFPWIIPAEILTYPRLGVLNFHFGLLPEYRGSDAIFWEIRNREPFGGVTAHQMTATLDAGPIAMMERVAIQPSDTYGLHMGNVAMAAMQMTGKLVQQFEAVPSAVSFAPQDESKARVWPKPGHEEVAIYWEQMNATEIVALIKACNPWNRGAYAFMGNVPLRILVATVSDQETNNSAPGTILQNENNWFVVCANNTCLQLETLYFDAGFFSASELNLLGFRNGLRFMSPPKFR